MQIKITDEKGIYSSYNIIHFIRENKDTIWWECSSNVSLIAIKEKTISLYGQLLCELSGKMIIKLFGNCTGGVCKEILSGWLKVVIAVMAPQLTEVIGET